MFTDALARIRAAEPGLRLGWSVPRVRRDYTTDMLTAIPALAILTGYRAALPARARTALREGRFDAIMAHWRVVTRALVRAVHEGGGELYVWTVDDAARIAKLTAMGVDGIITNDPRLFCGALGRDRRQASASSADQAGGGGEARRVGAGEAVAAGARRRARPARARCCRGATGS